MNKLMHYIVLFLIAGCLNLWSQSDSGFEIIPSNERLPVVLKMQHSTANFIVDGYEGNSVRVEVFRNNKQIELNSLPIKYTEKNNEITLKLLDNRKGYEFRVKVPRKTSLDLSIQWAKNIGVKNTEGDIKISTLTSDINLSNIVGNLDINSFNGSIDVENLDGCPILSNTRGKISLSFKKLPVDFPNIIETVSGTITLLLSENDPVLLRLRFSLPDHHFNLKSDFDLVPANANSFPGGGDDGISIYRTVNGGKSPIYLKTFKGTIEIIKKEIPEQNKN